MDCAFTGSASGAWTPRAARATALNGANVAGLRIHAARDGGMPRVEARTRRRCGRVHATPARNVAAAMTMTAAEQENVSEDKEAGSTEKTWPEKKGLEHFQMGQKVTGKVFRLVPFGAFVDIGATKAGLLHVRDMSTEFVDRPEDVVSNKQVVEVYIKYLDVEQQKLALSLLPRTATSRDKNLANFALGEEVKGTVQRVTNYGVFLDVGASCDAFLHVSDIWGRRPRETMESMRFGETVRAWVSHIDETKSFLRVSARASRKDKKAARSDSEALVDITEVFKRPSQSSANADETKDYMFEEDGGSDYS
ncbi:30S ribosomal protein S1 [Porphyridium purpureum]|uniref:30S ribosomal protein S1 n=1 Tax=Porphyridium purpureum TaxID=35688 RepID=A0A5J4YU14_PORPP|nr:30S ribosomal protein S1 [Porphyridium purpureum]|eukprot:POR3402..scf227_4